MKLAILTNLTAITCACAAMLITTGCGDSADTSTAAGEFSPDVTIPTQEEADAQAAAEITEDNADEVFRELEAEILGEGG